MFQKIGGENFLLGVTFKLLFEQEIFYQFTEDIQDMLQGFKVKTRRRRLRRLKEISAFNIAQHLASEGDIKSWNIPESVKPLVKKFLVTFSGN